MTADLFGGGLKIERNEFKYRKYGMTLAKVTNITDPDKLNRVLCKPVVAEDDADVLETEWCPVVTPLSGASCGQFFMPSVDDIVLVAYLNGDPHCPYVVGGTWNDESAFPYTIEDGKNIQYLIKTPKGNALLLCDEEEKEFISLTTPKGALIKMSDELQTMSFTDPDSKNMISLNWKDGKLEMTSAEEIALTCGSAKISMKKDGSITIEGKTLTIKGTDVSAEASNAFKAKGATADVEASGKLTLKGASADLTGSSGVNIN